ncbi:MAG: hypothetical protein WAL30_07095 [Candidatus Aquirickettsiella sp.]
MNNISINPVLLEAQKQLKATNLSIQAVIDAAKIVNENPNQIAQAFLHIESIIKENGGEAVLRAISTLCKEIDATKAEGLLVKTALEKVKPILSAAATFELSEFNKCLEKFDSATVSEAARALNGHHEQIETTFLHHAANEIFNSLFEKNQPLNTKQPVEFSAADGLKKFLKLTLHQGFIYFNINFLNTLNEQYLFLNPDKKINLSYNDEGLFIQVSFVNKKIYDTSSSKVFKAKDYFVKGGATYKVNNVRTEGGWEIEFKLIDSVLKCKGMANDILDPRSILEKFQCFLAELINTIKTYLSSNDSQRSKTKFKSFFFMSEEGTSALPKRISENNLDPTENILNLVV